MNSISPRQVKPEPEAQTTPWRRSIQQSSSVSMRMIHVCDINTTKFDVGRPGSGIQRADPSQYSYLVWHDAQRNLELCTPGGDCVHTCKRKKKRKKKTPNGALVAVVLCSSGASNPVAECRVMSDEVMSAATASKKRTNEWKERIRNNNSNNNTQHLTRCCTRICMQVKCIMRALIVYPGTKLAP